MVKTIKNNIFNPTDIDLRDDASHLKNGFGEIETWYHDAIFDNNYSLVSLINVLNIGKLGIVLTGLFIYKDSEPIKIIRNKYSISKLRGNDDKPTLKINEKEILNGYISKDKKWITNLSRKEENVKIDLDFIKNSKGFKGKTFLGNWLVIPHMDVKGSIIFKDKRFDVRGKGYHDHNIYPIYTPLKNKGYHFGKINLDSNYLTWARIIKNRNNRQLLAILSNGKEYLSIPQKDIKYDIIKTIKDHGKIIPKNITLNIKNDIIKLKLNIETINYHYIGVFITHYWRYHVRYIGEMEIESKIKKIDKNEITEYLKFF